MLNSSISVLLLCHICSFCYRILAFKTDIFTYVILIECFLVILSLLRWFWGFRKENKDEEVGDIGKYRYDRGLKLLFYWKHWAFVGRLQLQWKLHCSQTLYCGYRVWVTGYWEDRCSWNFIMLSACQVISHDVWQHFETYYARTFLREVHFVNDVMKIGNFEFWEQYDDITSMR